MPVIESHEEVQKKIDFSTLVFEKPAYGAVKLSVLFFFRRIFTIKKFRVVNNYLIALIVAWTLAFFFADLFSCGVHPEANWDPQAKEKYHCINLFAMLLTFAVTDVVTDIAILWMPYPQIKNLHMSTRDRWGLAGIFLMGTLDLVIGIVRLGFIVANQSESTFSGRGKHMLMSSYSYSSDKLEFQSARVHCANVLDGRRGCHWCDCSQFTCTGSSLQGEGKAGLKILVSQEALFSVGSPFVARGECHCTDRTDNLSVI